MEPELIIHTNKQAYMKFCLTIPVMIAFLSFALSFVKKFLGTSYPGIFFQGLLIIIIVGLLIMLIYSLYRMNRTMPMAIVNSSGVWVKQFGIIPWDNILEISAFPAPGAPSIGIQVRDAAVLAKQASIGGRLIIFQSKTLNCPTIVIDNIEVDSQTIIDFANQFIDQERE